MSSEPARDMEARVLWLLVAVLACGFSRLAGEYVGLCEYASDCLHPAAGRGPVGCKLAKRSQNDPALFRTAANQCAVPAEDRVDCGYPEITSEQCNNRGCCFDSSIPRVPWCFTPLRET
ncbi:hypothetical protein HPG69_016104, partial [Diceros bicornis minor]